MKSETKLQSKTIDFLRFPLSIAVIFIHMAPSVNGRTINWSSLSGIDLYGIIAVLFSRILSATVVPTFYLFSGFLFFLGIKAWSKDYYTGKIRKRVQTLLIPYILWNLIAFMSELGKKTGLYVIKGDNTIFDYLRELWANGSFMKLFWNSGIGGGELNWFGSRIPTYFPSDYPLWFLRDLIVVSLLSPFVYYLFKYLKQYGLILLGLFYITGVWVSIAGFSINALFFFSLGAYFSINGKNLIDSLQQAKIPFYILTFLSIIPFIYFDGTDTAIYFKPFFIIAGVISIINLTAYILEKKNFSISNTLVKSSFFVYALHGILVLGSCKIIFNKIFSPVSPLEITIGYLLIPFFTASVCLALFFFMKKFCPKLLGVLTGSRF